MLKERVVVYFTLLYWNLPGRINGKGGEAAIRTVAVPTKFTPGTSQT
jgi:hypothetical protein